ncbi:MAG: DUF1254 domain-containing protein [Chryseolinea sp.]
MKISAVTLLAVFAVCIRVNAQVSKETVQSVSTPDKVVTSHLGTLKFKDGVPDAATHQKLYDELDYIHGVDAFMNGFPAVSQFAIRKGFKDAGVNDNDVLVFSGLMDSRSVFLTANADTYYFWTYVDLTKGPMVVEIPPGVLGVFDDMWWRWICDIGTPGADRGVGGKYLLVPPGYNGTIPEGGYFIGRCRTLQASLLGRAFLTNNSPKEADETLKKQFRIYPYAEGGWGSSVGKFLEGEGKLGAITSSTPEMKFVEGTGREMNTVPPNDYSFYEMLNEAIQSQPASALDPEVAGHFAAIGIVKDKPFNPDTRLKKILLESATVGNAMSRNVSLNARSSEGFNYYGADSKWLIPLFIGGYDFQTPPPMVTREGVKLLPDDGAKKLNARIAMFYAATGITPAMCMRLPNLGSQYLGSGYDKNNNPFDGAKTYKIVLPAHIPAALFWSLTLYDNQTRSMLQTPQRYPRAGSQSYPTPAAVANTDGTFTIYFSPTKPPAVSDGNWIQTVPGKGWFTLFRLYSPLPAYFEKTWVLPDIEEVK